MKTLTPEEYRRLQKPRRHKFNAKRTHIDGLSFRSKGEGSCYALHKERERLGEIKIIQIEPTVRWAEIGVAYKPDGLFQVVATGELRYWEHKGVEGARWRVVKQIWRKIGPAPIDVYYQKGTQSYLRETIVPTGAAK